MNGHRAAVALLGGLIASPAWATTFADLTVSAPSPFTAGFGVSPLSVNIETSVLASTDGNPTDTAVSSADWVVTRTSQFYDPAMSFDLSWDLNQDPGDTALLRYQVSVGQAAVSGLLDCTFGCGPGFDFVTVDDAGLFLPLGQPETIPVTVSLEAWAIDPPIPEPGTLALLGGALVLLGLVRRQRRHPACSLASSGDLDDGGEWWLTQP